jgi:hypothetical protein
MGRAFDSFFFLPTVGTRGVVSLASKSDVVAISNPHYSNNALTVHMGDVGTTGWWFIEVYGPQTDVDKCLFIRELKDVWDLHPIPWVVVRDFNLIVDAVDTNNANLNQRIMGKFRKLLAEVELKELYLNGRRYTWTNEWKRATLECLDRVFSTMDWEVAFPSSFLSALSSSMLDHCPLLLSLAL